MWTPATDAKATNLSGRRRLKEMYPRIMEDATGCMMSPTDEFRRFFVSRNVLMQRALIESMITLLALALAAEPAIPEK